MVSIYMFVTILYTKSCRSLVNSNMRVKEQATVTYISVTIRLVLCSCLIINQGLHNKVFNSPY